ncbi:MAG: hypothetical protein WKF66_06490 [Pedobacter sp.]
MKDLEEKDPQQQEITSETKKEQEREQPTDTNWAQNQQVDEEGVEIDPEDVK